MTDSSDARDLIDRLADEFAARLRRGERPSIREYTEQYPEQADEVRDVLEAVALVECHKPESDDEVGSFSAPRVPTALRNLPEQLGDFQLIRYVAEGGMGYVYEAQQISMDRRVALKILKPHLVGHKSLGRFRREFQLPGKLHHNNIVPVFAVGQSDGFHFYAMQLIQGESLDKIIKDLRRFRDVEHEPTLAFAPAAPQATPSDSPGPSFQITAAATGTAVRTRASELAFRVQTGKFLAPKGCEEGEPTLADATASAVEQELPPRPARTDLPPAAGSSDAHSQLGTPSARPYYDQVARIGRDVAGALHYLGTQQVLHRDIKPANLLLDIHGVVWVADFGLAKGEQDFSLTGGEIPGTVRYMAPERFENKAPTTPQSDVYSLGMTLYELLTLRPAFDDGDLNQLIYDVTHETPPPPRSIDPHIPRDLEMIVLKAIERDPAARFKNANALAEELQRFIDRRPLTIRPVSWPERFARNGASASPGWPVRISPRRC